MHSILFIYMIYVIFIYIIVFCIEYINIITIIWGYFSTNHMLNLFLNVHILHYIRKIIKICYFIYDLEIVKCIFLRKKDFKF